MENTQFWELLAGQVENVFDITVAYGHVYVWIIDGERSETPWRDVVREHFGAERVRFEKQNGGKPLLYFDNELISFNITHTKGLTAFVFSKNGEVGIDVERNDRRVSDSLVRRMYHPQDIYKTLVGLEIWLLKESALKAEGTGLRFPMNEVILRVEDNHHWLLELGDKGSKYHGKFVRYGAFTIALSLQKY